MKITFKVGDEGDGHNIVRDQHFEINMSISLLIESFMAGCRKLDIEKFVDPCYKGFTFFNEYGQRYLPQEFVEKLEKSGIELEEFFYNNDWPSPEQDKRRKKKFSNYSSDVDSFVIFWLEVAKIGNPTLEFESARDNSIYIGGYGLVDA